MRRLTILLAALAALMLVPAASALANGTFTVHVEGNGSGEVVPYEEYGMPGEPPIACKYTSPGPATGTCKTELSGEPGFEGIWFQALAAPGSEFVGFAKRNESFFAKSGGGCPNTAEPEHLNRCGGYEFEAEEPTWEITAGFCKEGTGIAEKGVEWSPTFPQFEFVGCEEPSGPTNLRTLTLTKSPSSSVGSGNGSVSSKPKGIKCGATCDEAVASLYKETNVELTAKPSTGSSFVEWEGGDCDESKSTTCVIGMDKDETTNAVFGGTSKPFTPAEALTVSKGESTGKGTVKAAGLGCEAECTSTTVLYQGPITEPKAKAGKVVVLKQAPAFGSKFAGWSGCTEISETECEVKMESAKSVTAEYDALPSKTLTVNKSYAKGNGSVASKPKGIKCATTCTQAAAQMPEGAEVELVAKPTTGTFVKWEGGDCNGSTSTTCVVKMNTDETTTAVFSDPGKAIAEAKTLTLNKEGSGFGTVKASGLTCEVLCSSTSALFQGPIVGPKPKPGKVVVLKATSAPGTKAVAWTGCDSNPTPGECVVEMDEDHTVSASFDELE